MILAALLLLPVLSMSAQVNTAEKLDDHLIYLASDALLGRGFGTPQGLDAAHYIAAQMDEAGLLPLGESYLHPFNHREGILNIPGNNVIGMIKGSDPGLKDEYIVLGAHYDHLGWYFNGEDTIVFNGADDNASGTAGIIEVGRQLVARQAELGRSVLLVAFDGEESGLIGSRYFVENKTVDPLQIKAMFSLDMIGMVGQHGGLDLGGLGLLKDEEAILQQATAHSLVIKKSNSEIQRRTDTWFFGEAGIPSVHVNTGTESPYHQPEDDHEALDNEGMVKVVDFMSDVSVLLSASEDISSYERDPDKPKVFSHGFRLNLGASRHLYPDDWYRGGNVFATQAGYMMNLRLSPVLNLQPEVLYEFGGSDHPDGKYRSHALTLPVNLQLITPDDDWVRVFWEIGGFYSYRFAGTIDGTALDLDAQYSPHEAGMCFGIGMTGGPVQIGFYYQLGLTNLLQQPDISGTNMRASRIFYSIGWFF